MRRKEFEIYDKEIIQYFVKSNNVGSLAIYDKKSRYPEIFQLNYVLSDNYLYMHTFSASLKVQIIKKDPNSVFSIYKEYSVIPSYFIGVDKSSIDQFYKSVIIKGEIEIIKHKPTKKKALLALVNRFQPETEFDITELDDATLAKTAVLRIPFENYSAKFRFGQNMSDTEIESVCRHLLIRGTKIDIETESTIREIMKSK
jgi:uncharacterized protein